MDSQRLISNRYGTQTCPCRLMEWKSYFECGAMARRCLRDQASRNQSGGFRRPDPSCLHGFGEIYAVRPLSFIDGANIDLYYLGIHNKTATYANESAQRESAYHRDPALWGVRGAWDSNSEFRRSRPEHLATFTSWPGVQPRTTGYTLEPVPLQPRLGLHAGIARRRP